MSPLSRSGFAARPAGPRREAAAGASRRATCRPADSERAAAEAIRRPAARRALRANARSSGPILRKKKVSEDGAASADVQVGDERTRSPVEMNSVGDIIPVGGS